jgi:hypothetical protein
MKQILILKIRHVKDYILELTFDDNCIKQYDFSQIIDFKGISEPLKDIEYFKKVKIICEGRAFGWDNNYDCCADWARYYAPDLQNEWKDFDDDIGLKQRIKIAHQKINLTTVLNIGFLIYYIS